MAADCLATVIVINRNGRHFLADCLSALDRQSVPRWRFEVLFVDNASTDGSAAFVREHFPHVRLIDAGGNLGFTGANNLGIRLAHGRHVILLNNDTFLLPGWLDNLLGAFEDPAVTVAGSRLLYPTGHVQHAGVAFDDLGPHHVFVGLPGDSPVVLLERDLQVVTGAALAIRAGEFRRLGGFDTTYQNSFEDVDLCLRVRRDGGRVRYVPSSVAYHFESMTEGRVGPTDMRNYHLFMDRWSSVYERDLPGLEREAEAMGIDLEANRVPSRRDVMEREMRWARVERQIARLRRMRAVRAALWVRRRLRRLLPRR